MTKTQTLTSILQQTEADSLSQSRKQPVLGTLWLWKVWQLVELPHMSPPWGNTMMMMW